MPCKLKSWVAASMAALAIGHGVHAQCMNIETQQLVPPGGLMSGDAFGYACSESGCVIGAPGDDTTAVDAGAVYLPCGDWDYTKLLADDGAAGDRFGAAVSSYGSVLAIGAPDAHDLGAGAGAVYVFRHDGTTYVQEAKLLASTGGPGDAFGHAVAVRDDILTIGAPGDDDAGDDAGTVYFFEYDGATWVEQTKLLPATLGSGDHFGQSLSMSGSVLVAGAPADDDRGADAGAAYLYEWNGAAWIETQKLIANNGAAGDGFGNAVSVHRTHLDVMIGASGSDAQGTDSGAVYVFIIAPESPSSSYWIQAGGFLASDGAAGDRFGSSVANGDGVRLIGAAGDGDAGAAYAFILSHVLGWVERGRLEASNAASGDLLGFAVGLSGTRAILTAPGSGVGAPGGGAAYVFPYLADCNVNDVLDLCDYQAGVSTDDNDNGLLDDCELQVCVLPEDEKLFSSPDYDDKIGVSVAIDYDVAVVGAPGDDTSGVDVGAAHVYRYDENNETWMYTNSLRRGDYYDRFGEAVATKSLVIVVGAPGNDELGLDAGAAYVYRFDGVHWIWEATLLADDGAIGNKFGSSVAVLDEDRVVIGAPFGSGGGAAYVFEHDAGTWTQSAKLAPSDGAGADLFGTSVAAHGSRIIVGAPFHDHGEPYGPSAAYCYRFDYDAQAWVEEQELLAADGQPGDRFGQAVAAQSETMIVTAPNDDDKGVDAGAAYIFEFDGATWHESVKLRAPDGSGGDHFGYSVAVVTGSKSTTRRGPYRGSIVVGATGNSPSGAGSGAAYVYFHDYSGSPAPGWNEGAKLAAFDGEAFDRFGWSVATNSSNILVGAPYADDADVPCGAAYLFPGIDDCNANGVLDACDVLLGTSPDLNGNGSPDECDPTSIIIDEGETVVVNPGTGPDDPFSECLIEFTNVSGGDGASLFVQDQFQNEFPDAGRYKVDLISRQLFVTTSLEDGEFFMRVSIPYPGWARLFGLPDQYYPLWHTDVVYYDEATEDWVLAVDRNTANSPGHPGPRGDRFTELAEVVPALSDDVGDYGRVIRPLPNPPSHNEGFAWANVDHATVFAVGERLCRADLDESGEVAFPDLLAVLGAWGPCSACPEDLNGDESVGFSDLLQLLATWGPCVE